MSMEETLCHPIKGSCQPGFEYCLQCPIYLFCKHLFCVSGMLGRVLDTQRNDM